MKHLLPLKLSNTKLKDEKLYLFLIVAFLLSVVAIAILTFVLKTGIALLDAGVATWR